MLILTVYTPIPEIQVPKTGLYMHIPEHSDISVVALSGLQFTVVSAQIKADTHTFRCNELCEPAVHP